MKPAARSPAAVRAVESRGLFPRPALRFKESAQPYRFIVAAQYGLVQEDPHTVAGQNQGAAMKATWIHLDHMRFCRKRIGFSLLPKTRGSLL